MGRKSYHNIKLDLVELFGPKCHWCKDEFPVWALECDHVIPQSWPHAPKGSKNIVLACLPCNQARGCSGETNLKEIARMRKAWLVRHETRDRR